MFKDAETEQADQRARERAQQRHGDRPAEPPTAALIEERTRAGIEGRGQDFRADIAKSTEGLADAVTRALRNPALGNEAQQAMHVAALATQRQNEILARTDVRREAVAKQRATVAAQVAAAYQPRDPVHAAQAAEIRTMLRGMTDAERDRVLNAAKETGDYPALMYSITSAPSALSGVSPGQHHEMRRVALAVANPELLTLPEDIDQELKLLDECEEGVRTTIAELVDFNKADALRQLMDGPA